MTKGLAYRTHPKSLSSPHSLSLMHIDSIVDQHLSDILFAYDSAITDSKMHRLLVLWAKKQRINRCIVNKTLLLQPLNIGELLYCIFSPGFSSREKLNALFAFFESNVSMLPKSFAKRSSIAYVDSSIYFLPF